MLDVRHERGAQGQLMRKLLTHLRGNFGYNLDSWILCSESRKCTNYLVHIRLGHCTLI